MQEEKGKLLSLDDVRKIIPVSKATWYRGMRDGRYPKPIKISLRRVAWRESEIQALCIGQSTESTNEEAASANEVNEK